MPMRSVKWAEALIPALYKWFDVGRRLRPTLIPALYNVQGSSSAFEAHIGMGGMYPDAFDGYENTGNKTEVEFDKGWETTFTHYEKVVQFNVERKFQDDDKVGIITQRARKLGILAAQKMELDAASTFIHAFTDTFAGADAVGLCSTAHADSPTNTAVQSNEGTYALNNANIDLVRIAMMGFKDDKGNPIGVTPSLILVPPQLESLAIRACGSPQLPGTAENDINPQANRWSVQPWHMLTDVNAWFMIDPVWMKESLYWYNRTPLEIQLVNSTTTEFQYEIYYRMSWGWVDWRWIYGNNPS